MPALTHSSETETVVGIQFAVFSPDEIISRSVVEITSHSTQDGKVGGLADPRLGVLENGKICRTCQQNNHNCPGHFGHYKLARPIYFYQFFNLIMKILRCTCIKCAKLLINKDKAKTLRRAQGENRWNVVFAACQDINRCGESTEDGCGARQPDKYVVEDICRIVAEWKNMSPTGEEGGESGGNIRRFLEPEYVYRLLRRISDEDVDFMGFSRLWCRPDWMMCSVLPIPPPHVRPSVLQDNNQKSEDDLTQKLVDIIKTNIKLADLMEKGNRNKSVGEWTVLLQYHLATYVDNNIPGVAQSAQRSGRPLKSLQQRLGTKEGRIRNNLQGKRVEFSARSVITPDPNISVGELGVPFKIAMNLTFPETVRADNLDHLYALVRNGPNVYPGARSIKRLDGRTVSLKHVDTSTIMLYEGDEVNRHMLDGDPVLFNRQPSLHRMSMMCHKVRVLPGSTFRLNVSVTKPYNADFDGDEMNLHAAQSVETNVELREIPAVAKQMIGPRQSKALIGIVQDTLVGVNRLTRPTEFFPLREFMNLLIHAKRWNGVIPEPAQTSPVPRWSGRQVVSALLPSIYLSMPNKAWKKEDGPKSDNYVVIRNGVIEQGILDGDIFDKGLILVMFNDFGPDITVDFIDSLQAVVAAYLQNYGFSVGLSDLIADPATMLEIAAKSAESKNQLESLQLRVHMGLFENTTGRTNQEEFENLAFQALNKTTEAVGDIGIKALTSNNRMINMIKCGSKGKTINMAQMLSLLGQQAIEGKRVGYGFQDRTLPHFKRYDDGAEARGYIERSFVRGLKPSEFFFHAMTGREGLIDTAVKSVTGDTEISVVETVSGRWFTTTIGAWVDSLMAAAPSTIQHSQPANLELLPTSGFAIWTADTMSRASVEPITAVTRHDPGDVLFHIVVSTGAAVTVSANKSLCIYGPDGILRECAPADVCVGDSVCVLSRGDCVRAGFFTEEVLGVQRATITSIERQPVTDPRMRLYDLTVPATLNFALANGLVVRDTADSGYMQRKLVKTMEDLMVFFDGSVRDSGGLVVQFAYGDDRTSATKIENQSLPLAKFSDSEIRARFTVQDVDAARAQSHLELVFEDRDVLVRGVWNGHVESSVQSAVNLQRLIADAIANMNFQDSVVVSGAHVLDVMGSIIQRTNPHNRLWATLLRFYLNPSDLQRQGFTEAAFDWLAEQIVVKHMKSWVVPGEMAGIIAAQSIGEPLTQLTLNSVDWETEIVIACDGHLMTPRIGEFIDNYIAGCDHARVQHLPNEQLFVSLEGDGHDWKAVSCDADGRMQWTRLEAITKHPVVNEDGSDTILEVETENGCVVRATKARSFLRFEDGKLVATNGSDLKVGDLLPIANNLAIEELGLITELDLRSVLPASEWLYGTEVAKALIAMRGERHWFKESNGKQFTVPYNRSDSFRDAFIGGKNMHAENIREGFVYPKKLWTKLSQIPDKIPLTREFGFLCGAYLAEGNTNDKETQVYITNNDNMFLEPIRKLMDNWNVGYHTVNCDKVIENTGIKGHTQSLIIHSTTCAAFMTKLFGRISYEKKLPNWVLHAPDEYIKGLVDGYISGDGTIAKIGHMIHVSSVSETLLTSFSLLMARYGIFGTHTTFMPKIQRFKHVSRQFSYNILKKYANVFAKQFTLTIPHKQTLLDELSAMTEPILCHRSEFNDTILDKIKKITECHPKDGRVYDVTVEGTRNFMLRNKLLMRDTFHLSGFSSKAGMTRGVPRLKELLMVTQNPKASSLTIHLRPDLRNSQDEARRLAQDFEFTLLKDLVTTSRIYYDPRDAATLVTEDAEWLRFFAEFEQTQDVESPSPWIVRIELDREKMFTKNITIEDIVFTLRSAFEGQIPIAFTDHNASRLILRIRFPPAVAKKGAVALDELDNIKQQQNKLLTQVLIRGLPGLRAVTFRKLEDEKESIYEKAPGSEKYEKVDQFVLDTLGSNLLDVMNHPSVDGLNVLSNHIHDVYENLGIEAARQVLFREIFTIFEQGEPVNQRHVSLLCDAMCNKGRLMPADRYGVNKKKTGVLIKASFEQAEQLMIKASTFAELDACTGVSANIMLGQAIKGGTSFTHILLDEDAFLQFTRTSPNPRKFDNLKRIPKLTENEIKQILDRKDRQGCSTQDLTVSAVLPFADERIVTSQIELPEIEVNIVDDD